MSLTRAEQEVFEVLLTGAHNREIAQELSLSEATIRTHLTHIYSKFEVDGRAALLARLRGGAMIEPLRRRPRARRQRWRHWVIAMVLVVLLAVALVAFAYFSFALTSHGSPTQPRGFGMAGAAGAQATQLVMAPMISVVGVRTP